MAATLATIGLAYAVTLNTTVSLLEKGRPCDDCKEPGKTPKQSEYSKKGFRLFLCEECLRVRDRKRGS